MDLERPLQKDNTSVPQALDRRSGLVTSVPQTHGACRPFHNTSTVIEISDGPTVPKERPLLNHVTDHSNPACPLHIQHVRSSVRTAITKDRTPVPFKLGRNMIFLFCQLTKVGNIYLLVSYFFSMAKLNKAHKTRYHNIDL